jgi:predicted amidohydrolase
MEGVGQTMEQAESCLRPGPLLNAYRAFAERNHCCVAGSVKLEDKGKIYNALAFIGPQGEWLGDYRKNFLTGGELQAGLTPGDAPAVVATPVGRLGGVICFDLNFDELRDAYRLLKPDVLCFSSYFHGEHLQRNWAYQCRCFLAAACKDNSSDIVDPLGRIVASTNFYGRIAWARVNLDRFVMHQDRNNARFADIRRKYGNQVQIDVAMALGVAVLYSLDNRRSAVEIAREFELIAIDDYFNDSRKKLQKKLRL